MKHLRCKTIYCIEPSDPLEEQCQLPSCSVTEVVEPPSAAVAAAAAIAAAGVAGGRNLTAKNTNVSFEVHDISGVDRIAHLSRSKSCGKLQRRWSMRQGKHNSAPTNENEEATRRLGH